MLNMKTPPPLPQQQQKKIKKSDPLVFKLSEELSLHAGSLINAEK